jgi:hypothetical protein
MLGGCRTLGVLVSVAVATVASCAGTAFATLPDGNLAEVALSPAAPARATTAVISVSPPDEPTLTGLLSVTFMDGFRSSISSVATLCTAAQGAAGQCPPVSLAGSGTVTVHEASGTSVLPLTLGLGAPSQPGDIATIYMDSEADGRVASASARLLTGANAGSELLIPNVAALAAPGARIEGLTLTLHAQRTVTTVKSVRKLVGKGRRRRRRRVKEAVHTTYSLLETPSLCTSPWTGASSFTSGDVAFGTSYTMPCTPVFGSS